jgi:hypothetical protein
VSLYISGLPCIRDCDLAFEVRLEVTPPEGEWVSARLDEATAYVGPWQEVETFDLSDQHGISYVLATTVGEFSAGLLRAILTDADGETWTSEPEQRHESVWHGIRCDLSTVAALVRSRTVDGGGKRQNAWTETTVPTASQVEELIDHATDLVSLETGSRIPARLRPMARTVVALQAAILMAESHTPEANDESGHQSFVASFLRARDSLVSSVRGAAAVSSGRRSFGSIPVLGHNGVL